jgi:hypothetical protein
LRLEIKGDVENDNLQVSRFEKESIEYCKILIKYEMRMERKRSVILSV